VPQACRAYAGIGCHFMSQWMDRNTLGWTHMAARVRTGSRGAVQQAQYEFQNLGDGTYNHSGYLAIRAPPPPRQHHLQICSTTRSR